MRKRTREEEEGVDERVCWEWEGCTRKSKKHPKNPKNNTKQEEEKRLRVTPFYFYLFILHLTKDCKMNKYIKIQQQQDAGSIYFFSPHTSYHSPVPTLSQLNSTQLEGGGEGRGEGEGCGQGERLPQPSRSPLLPLLPPPPPFFLSHGGTTTTILSPSLPFPPPCTNPVHATKGRIGTCSECGPVVIAVLVSLFSPCFLSPRFFFSSVPPKKKKKNNAITNNNNHTNSSSMFIFFVLRLSTRNKKNKKKLQKNTQRPPKGLVFDVFFFFFC